MTATTEEKGADMSTVGSDKEGEVDKMPTHPESNGISNNGDLPSKSEYPSMIDIKKSIPAHCFVSNTPLSAYYMFKDFFLIAVVFALVNWSWEVLPPVAQLVITPVYWLVQGTLFTAIFVVGHDAGHGSFSSNETINSFCGNFCHTFVLTPYYMWKLSHRNHHKNTANIDKDEVFYPVRKRDDPQTCLMPGFGLFVGWFGYLLRGYRPRQVYHFNPWDALFGPRNVFSCMLSLGSYVGWMAAVLHFANTHDWWGPLTYHYLMPLAVFGSFIVIITFLHHSDMGVPWYTDEMWDNVKGRLCSVDRSYGWCHGLIHDIGTHQVHHLFPKMPHYHLEEATQHFRKTFPHLVRINNERILPAFYRMFIKYLRQNVMEDETKVYFYK